MENAKKSGKLVLTVDTSSDFADCDGYIGTDQYLAAYKQGAYAAKLVKDGQADCFVTGISSENKYSKKTMQTP